MMDQELERQVVIFSGRVQGVGFRYVTLRLAARYRVTGFVRNLHDGRVEMVVEGAKAETQQLVADIRERMGAHIQSLDVHRSAATGEFEDFQIRF
jgi:acylphosphatase